MKRVKYREHTEAEFLWFWINDEGARVSPAFDTPEEANIWYGQQIRRWQASDS